MKYIRIPKHLIISTVLILLCLAAFCFPACGEDSADGSNLVWNSGFELLEDERLPDGWYTDAWYNQVGYTEYNVLQDEDPERGQIFEIQNFAPNDARIAQIVDVDPDTVYCLSGYIRAEGIEGGYIDPAELGNAQKLREAMLNGARDWMQYSWGGCSLCYNGQIAERLCTPSELKRTKGGENPPNKGEEWLDVQARALYQAAALIIEAARG